MPKYWRNGYAAEAVEALLQFCKCELRLNRVVSETQSVNMQSRSMLEKLGYIIENETERFGEKQCIYAFNFAKRNMNYTLIRSKRKTIGISIKDGLVTVRAPLKCPQSEIERIILSKEKWIWDKLDKSQEQMARREAFALKYGDSIILRGVSYEIAAREGVHAGFDGECFYMPPGFSDVQIKDTCIKIYRYIAKVHISERIELYAGKMGIRPASIKINSAKTRWGSCSSKQNINFSWRLIMADDDVIDYVVVHELAHIIQMNHSKKFWAIVENVLPDYRERNDKLKKLQKRLAGEDWG